MLLTTVDEDILASSDGTVVTKRPLSFYVRGKLGDEERRRLQYSAVSGAEVLRRSRERAWGLELPWRLVKLSVVPQAQARSLVVASSKPSSAKPSGHETDAKSKRRRPGKKKRIALRIKEKARKEKEAAEAQKKLTKEEHLKEKKKRLNRERKLKRRQKEREKKMSCGGGGIAAPGNPEDGTVSASE